MKRVLLILVVLTSFAFTIDDKPITGFSELSSSIEKQLEQQYDALLQTADIDAFMKQLSAHPHHLSSEWNKQNALFLLKNYQSWGYEAHIDTFYTLFPTPKTRLLELVSPTKFTASLSEPPIKEFPSTAFTKEQLPPYNCFSPDGDVTGDLVFVNYGVLDDYEQLERLGIDVKGKIVIAKYAGSWRGIKPRLAQEHGAIGCIIYSDPKDDGYYQGDVIPKGTFRNEHGVQRGSVLNAPLYPGDPLTPGVGHTKDAKAVDRKDAKSLPKIPVLPISYGDAKPLLQALAGAVAPESWRGALPITYHVGPGPAKVHLKLEFNWNVVPVLDVIATLKGSEFPDQWVMRGNHYDAWVNGAIDPITGQASMLAEAKAIGLLAKQGQRPQRTIVFCSWDGEEEGLVGSTEYAEAHAEELQQKVVAYINTDGTDRGFFHAGASHVLQSFINEAASDVKDPLTGINVVKRKIAKEITDAADIKTKKDMISNTTMKVNALGSGSDYSSFLQHLGIASIDLGYGGEVEGGEYHSIYDTYEDFVQFKDIDFKYEIAIAQTAGRMTLRLANADVLPFNFSDLYSTVNEYVTDLTKKVDDMRLTTELTNKAIKENYYVYASDPKKTYVQAKPKDSVPNLDFSALQNAVAKLKLSAEQYNKADLTLLETSVKNKLNPLLYQSERKLLIEAGLPTRPFYRHSIYAPGYYTGYGVKTMPGIREAIENRDWPLAQQQITVAANAIDAYTRQVNEALAVLPQPKGSH